ncbi:DNA replication complex GINS family protein [Candidatus Woesearchaeota archaeon]|jgi:DNA replication initiation complex subunit (GINS family)|nr:DNA replication complex GINS family protein [Candidatus Woesearchaeota archaeon]MBT4110821.1 DNA replication complex GINS family protein [Candidatus Woesearchaeota archaeon]MBT4336667.1 DNA replication complex GINS family protein [Candidatus Woesearchaeota archaeon]MBT4469584.1 DNA replication complex GINS family protein [Candidatus Woesearchaeota archaeon]MBT6743946.1 DNA replication complex GINS family protein [Candidatus Woesearchaeota archaeon]
MEDIKITLETLYDILRNEKKKEELQTLEETFFADVVSYLKEKKMFLDLKKDDDDPFASGEKDKLEYEIRSIKRILKEIYEKREKKILDIALNKSRTGSEIIDAGSMLKEEKDFYKKVLDILDLHRKGIILNLFQGKLPQLFDSEVKESPADQKLTDVKVEVEKTSGPTVETSKVTSSNATEETTGSEDATETTENPEETTSKIEIELMKIKMVKPMPSFVWKDMKVYGPYEIGDEVEIFPEVAELMVRKGRAEKV